MFLCVLLRVTAYNSYMPLCYIFLYIGQFTLWHCYSVSHRHYYLVYGDDDDNDVLFVIFVDFIVYDLFIIVLIVIVVSHSFGALFYIYYSIDAQ